MAGLDGDTKLLVNFDGADAATAASDQSDSNHSLNFNGTAQLDTAYPKWGSAALLLDGDSDYLTLADSPDWDLSGVVADDWTVDFWIKDAVGNPADNTILYQYQDDNNRWNLFFPDIGGQGRFTFQFILAGANLVYLQHAAASISDTDYHHCALIKVGSEYGLYIDGSQVAYVQSTGTGTLAGTLLVGATYYSTAYGAYWNGWLDELRFQKSNYFGAAPDAGLANTFSVPTGPYSRVTAKPRSQAIFIT